MNIVLLSGGSGKRLWPLSNDIRSKQFIKLFKNPDGEYESMVQRVYRQIRCAAPDANITFATSRSQASAIYNQIGDAAGICAEPCRRDTFPAISLAAAWLRDKKHVLAEEPVVVCPVDPFAGEDYFDAIVELGKLAESGASDLALLGILPSYPSEKYGYILPEDDRPVSRVKLFQEKPDAETAQRYIEQGALWNGGIFAARLG